MGAEANVRRERFRMEAVTLEFGTPKVQNTLNRSGKMECRTDTPSLESDALRIIA